MRLVMIDNYDSFTYNLVQLFYEFDLEVLVYRHDQVSLEDVERLQPDWICISPGPRDPAHAGISKAVIECFAGRIPTLGVCLGMQAINEVFGGETLKAPIPMHGKRCKVHHVGRDIFRGIPSPFWAARYHSLCIKLPVSERTEDAPPLVPLAFAADGVIMSIRHRWWPLWGVQFHPESFMTEFGVELVTNFLNMHQADTGKSIPYPATADPFPRLGWPTPSSFSSDLAREREAS